MQSIKIKNDNRYIPAVVIVPDGEGPFPAVVMNHGHGGSKEEHGGFTSLAKAFAKKGILTIRMDFPGSGESTEPFTENCLSNMISDSNTSLEYILENHNVDKTKLGIFGYSMGGRVALTIVKGKDSPYSAVGLLAPSTDPGENVIKSIVGSDDECKRLEKEAMSKKGYADFENEFIGHQTLSLRWINEMKNSYPRDDISNFEGDMLLVYGGKDFVVTPIENKEVLLAFPSAKEVFIEDADHGYGFSGEQPSVTDIVEESFTTFFEEKLK